VRHRLGWRQADVAARARISQDTVSRVERGQLDALQLRTVRAVLRVLEMDLALVPRWRGGDLDRLTDEGHAALVARVSDLLVAAGWSVMPEVSYSHFGERGSIDVLAWHEATRVLLVVEVKTAITSVEETLRRHDAKVRLAPMVARERLGWNAASAVPLLVLPDESTARRRVARVDEILSRRYPVRGRDVSRWIRTPVHSPGLLMFLSPKPGRRGGRTRTGRKRVFAPRRGVSRSKDAPQASPTATDAAAARNTPRARR